MQEGRIPPVDDRFTHVISKETVVASVKQRFRSKINPVLCELHVLLPRRSKSVDLSQYARDRDEAMALTAAYCDSSLDVAGLEALMRDVENLRQGFTGTLGRAREVA